MKRRSFIESGTLAPIAALSHSLFSSTSCAQNVSMRAGLTDTIEDRYYYLKRHLHTLCTKYGPRPAGSEAYNSGIRLIADEMKRSLPEVFLDEFSIDRWELAGEPSLTVGGTAIETFPHHGSAGTSEVGIRGVLRKYDKGFPYGIADHRTGAKLAEIAVSNYGPAIPANAYRNGALYELPRFGVGKFDRPLLERAAAKNSHASALSLIKITPDVPSWNAVGTLPGKTDREIMVIAHADTVYSSPGANDNTASVIIMLMIAHEVAKKDHNFTLRFVASGSEELGYQGAYGYANRRASESTMNNIEYIIQFDSLTYGPDFLLTSEDTELRELADSINTEFNISGTPRHIDSTEWVMDSLPFKTSGARAIYINSRGYDGITLPVYHRREDIPETVGFDCVDNSFRVFTEFVRRLDRL